MTNKAYIVANEEQEIKILMEFERRGYRWINTNEKPISNGSLVGRELEDYPLFIGERIETKTIYWQDINQLTNEEIVYDGRKEEKMKISKGVYDALVEWKERRHLQPHVSFDSQYVSWQDLESMAIDIKKWWYQIGINDIEINNRLIAILRWVNGEDVFKVEKPKKWVVRSKEHDEGGHYQYVIAGDFDMSFNEYHIGYATRFDTKEEAESWANAHQEVVEIESD